MKISPKRYIQGFCIAVVVLGWARELKPSLAYSNEEKMAADSITQIEDSLAQVAIVADKAAEEQMVPETEAKDVETKVENKEEVKAEADPNEFALGIKDDPAFRPHRIFSVSSFKNSFPDQNDVQLIAAQKNGVKPVANQNEAEKRKDELVYVGSNPYFYVDRLKNSIPYLVPKASVLLQDIGRTFYDSLQIKGIPLHKVIVTSLLRSKEDVANLQKRNQNAAPNSCHCYGTTFDICYNRYKTVESPDGPRRREVRNDSLKWVLSEVLNDIRKQDRCYVKYEVKQGCYHITVR